MVRKGTTAEPESVACQSAPTVLFALALCFPRVLVLKTLRTRASKLFLIAPSTAFLKRFQHHPKKMDAHENVPTFQIAVTVICMASTSMWDYDYEGLSNIIDVIIKNIRKKLDVGSQ